MMKKSLVFTTHKIVHDSSSFRVKNELTKKRTKYTDKHTVPLFFCPLSDQKLVVHINW
jgi:hypothetical protein